MALSPVHATERPLRVLFDQVPLTLNPRQAIDAAGQRIGALIFRALTRNDTELVPRPDLAESRADTERPGQAVF